MQLKIVYIEKFLSDLDKNRYAYAPHGVHLVAF